MLGLKRRAPALLSQSHQIADSLALEGFACFQISHNRSREEGRAEDHVLLARGAAPCCPCWNASATTTRQWWTHEARKSNGDIGRKERVVHQLQETSREGGTSPSWPKPPRPLTPRLPCSAGRVKASEPGPSMPTRCGLSKTQEATWNGTFAQESLWKGGAGHDPLCFRTLATSFKHRRSNSMGSRPWRALHIARLWSASRREPQSSKPMLESDIHGLANAPLGSHAVQPEALLLRWPAQGRAIVPAPRWDVFVLCKFASQATPAWAAKVRIARRRLAASTSSAS